ncbi:MAG: aminotransferase, partial [Acidimicrobiia bacterium]
MATQLPRSIRDRFPILERAVYTNSCSQGALSNDVRAAYEQYMTDWDDKGAPWELWVEQAEGARARFARLLNASPDEVAVTTSV